MSEAALKKLTDEKEKLETEVKLLAEAQPVNAACEQLVESIKKTTEPLGDSTILPEGEGNPWADESGGGCIIC